MINFVIILLVCQFVHIFCTINDPNGKKVINSTKLRNFDDQNDELHQYRPPRLATADQTTTPFKLPTYYLKKPIYGSSNSKADSSKGQLHKKTKRTVGQDDEKLPNKLRLYFCGTGYQNCMYDDR